MTSNKEIYITFLLSEIEKGSQRGEAMSAFVKKWRVTDRTFDRHWKIAKERYKDVHAATQKALSEQSIELAKEANKRAILTKLERLEIASKIAQGVSRKVGNQLITPTDGDRIRAMDYISKIEGDYAPVRQENRNVDKEGNDVKQTIIIGGKEIDF